MKSYLLPQTNVEISRLAYGCMNLGGSWDAEPPAGATLSQAARLIDRACELGITLFDHANIYTRGKSELVFGQLLGQRPGRREQLIIQSKCGIRFRDDPRPGLPQRYDFSYEHIIQSVAGSLGRLQTDYLDILLLHRPDPLVEPEEVARAFDQLYHSGQVRHFGVSNHTAAQIALLQSYVNQPLVVNQVELNLLHNDLIGDGILANQKANRYAAAGGTLDYCRQHNILVQAWAPVAGGRLFAPAGTPLPDLIAQMAAAKGTSSEAIALGWLLRHPAGIQPIIGTTNPARLQASCQADSLSLSHEEWYELFIAARGQPLP